MGFTIDMVSGNVSEITNGTDSVNSEEAASTSASRRKKDTFESYVQEPVIQEPYTQERLLPVSDSFVPESMSEKCVIPDFLIDSDIDSFIEDVAQ